MKRNLKYLIFALFIYLVYGVYLSQVDLNINSNSMQKVHPTGFFDYSGVMNVMTDKSTGSGTFADVVEAAQRSDLDFIFITDLNDFTPNKKNEKYYEQLLVCIDAKYSYLDSRWLIYGKNNYDDLNGFGQTQVFLGDQLNQTKKEEVKQMIVLAHPFKKGFLWNGPVPEGVYGIEILNLKSIWQNAWLEKKISFLWSVFIFPFNPELSLIRLFSLPLKELELWDLENKTHKLLAFAGSEAEAKLKFPASLGLKIPPYSTIFNLLRTHILLTSELTGQFANDKQKILRGLKEGAFYLSIDALADPRGFNAVVSAGPGHTHLMGSSFALETGQRLSISLPEKLKYPFEVNIYKDGKKLLSANTFNTEYLLQESGVYRVVIRLMPSLPLPDSKKWLPWIFTNPFFVRH